MFQAGLKMDAKGQERRLGWTSYGEVATKTGTVSRMSRPWLLPLRVFLLLLWLVN